VAIEPSEIAVITRDTFLFLVHETPMFALLVMRSLARRIRELDDRI
jgi:CRP-like cAMP-binding protein